MSKAYIPRKLKEELQRIAAGRCEYCKFLVGCQVISEMLNSAVSTSSADCTIAQPIRNYLTAYLERYSPAYFECDHVIPLSKGGKTEFANLARACRICNGDKRHITHSLDPLTHQIVSLFHPRQQKWSDHFAWSENKFFIVGKTPEGRATVIAMKLNRSAAVNLRRLTLATGEHPPKED